MAWIPTFNDLAKMLTIDSSGNPAGSVVVRDVGVISQSRNRNRSSVTSTREKVTWTTADNIREITVTALTTDTAASNDSEGLAFCVNAGSDAIADAWLTETDVEADDVQYELIKVNGKERTFRFTSALTRLDMVAIGGTDTTFRVHIGAH